LVQTDKRPCVTSIHSTSKIYRGTTNFRETKLVYEHYLLQFSLHNSTTNTSIEILKTAGKLLACYLQSVYRSKKLNCFCITGGRIYVVQWCAGASGKQQNVVGVQSSDIIGGRKQKMDG